MSQVFYLNLADTRLAYRIYENPQATKRGTALFIHGAGVGGEITWSAILEHLTLWQRIVVPDLKGMGETFAHHGEEEAVSIEGLGNEMLALIEALALKDFDLIGYSLGGLVSLQLNHRLNEKHQAGNLAQTRIAKMCLLEPASLDRETHAELVQLRENYKKAAITIRETGDVELGIAHFVDSVAPNRRKHPIAEATTQSRLAHRAIGFSYALDAVTDFVEQQGSDIRDRLLEKAPATLLLAGELSHSSLNSFYALLAQQNTDWQYRSLSACDHSLPFQKPRQIAKLITQWFDPGAV